VSHQLRHQFLQPFRISEHDVGRPLALITGPVIIGWVLLEDRFVQRIQLLPELFQHLLPVHFQLLVHQLLRPFIILDPRKAVTLFAVLELVTLHLPR
jgi:hypothetical protein